MKYEVKSSATYEKDIKKLAKSGIKYKDRRDDIINHLKQTGSLPDKYESKQLGGNLKAYYSCRVTYRLRLIYTVFEKERLIVLVRIGHRKDIYG